VDKEWIPRSADGVVSREHWDGNAPSTLFRDS
jgi:hypothetical protein